MDREARTRKPGPSLYHFRSAALREAPSPRTRLVDQQQNRRTNSGLGFSQNRPEAMNSFSIARKKTPFQKHREEEEARKKREEDETARLYQEFVESFQGDNTPGSKTFVRGGVINPNEKLKADSEGEKSKDGVSIPKKGSRYVPSFLPPPSILKEKEPEKKRQEERPKDKEKGKSRNIDKFLEELKHEQEMRERRNQDRKYSRDGRHSESSSLHSGFDELPDEFDPGRFGSFDDGDPLTTNLYVGNLAPQVDENFLLRTFGRFGPIASVKIMWPRTDEEKRRQRNCGFVAFMNRADGQAAKDEMQGVIVYDYELKIGWGKSVSLPSQALPAPPPGHMAIRSKEGATVILSGSSATPVTSLPNQKAELVLTPNVPDIMVTPPEDNHLRHIIDTMALYVLDGGCAFEQAIMERGRGNPLFNFLFELGSKEHTYYVWRLYSFAQGDTLRRWRTEPFIMIAGSGRWMPPPLPSSKSPDHEEASGTFAAGRSRNRELERPLSDSQRDEFEDMLRSLTLERSQIREAMAFALDNADAAGEIVEVLTESLTLKETPILTKVARLMLVSDILHNSSAPMKNASAYRTKFELSLPDIMESFNDLYCSITGRITAEALKERVLKVLQVWSDWFLFSDAYVNGLRATFMRSMNSGVALFHSVSGVAPETEQEASAELGGDGCRPDAAVKELLGLPITELQRHCRHNGLSLVGGREMMVARLLNLEEAEKQRGSELGSDLKQMQSHSNSSKYPVVPAVENISTSSGWNRIARKSSASPIHATVSPSMTIQLPVSKWACDDDGSDDDRKRDEKGFGLLYSSSGSEDMEIKGRKAGSGSATIEANLTAQPDNGMNDEQRQKLRRLEVAVMEYRESLEERGTRDAGEIDQKVANHKKKLQADLGLSDSTGVVSQNKKTSESRDKNQLDSLRKRHRSRSRSGSPPCKSSSRDWDKERSTSKDRESHPTCKSSSIDRDKERSTSKDRERHHDRDRRRDSSRETERWRDREKSGSRERRDDDYEMDRERDRRRRLR